MRQVLFFVLISFVTSSPLCADPGLVEVESAYSVKVTADRLEQVLQEKGMTIFNRVRHSAAAKDVGIQLRATELIIFGNPKIGSRMMQCAQTVGIDLPQKFLIYQDAAGTVLIVYNAPDYLQRRHVVSGCDAVFAKVSAALAGIAGKAAE